MKIGLPSTGTRGLDDMIGEHFGRVPYYAIVDSETMETKVIENTSNHMGGTLAPPELLKEKGVEVMICRGLGRKAVAMFNDMDICVYVEANGTIRECIDAFKKEELSVATEQNACSQHAFGDHHHHH